jgi:hypothetical protein
MNPRIRTRPKQRGDARRYLAKANEFAESARDERAAGRWTAAGLAAVHAGISAADAVTSLRAGCVSAGDDHMEVVGLLREYAPDDFTKATERQLVGLLSTKAAIEYDDEPLSQARAVTLVDQATRFVEWASAIVRQ